MQNNLIISKLQDWLAQRIKNDLTKTNYPQNRRSRHFALRNLQHNHTNQTNQLIIKGILINQKTGSVRKPLMGHEVMGAITRLIHRVIHRYCG